ncbi:hypothetical protein KGO95_03005 [Patescibacteria group bacterium]|nr:hypothetical protein [Patescibacteria group bacterium]
MTGPDEQEVNGRKHGSKAMSGRVDPLNPFPSPREDMSDEEYLEEMKDQGAHFLFI